MTEPDVDALIAWHEEAARRLDGPGLGQTGDYHTKAATALRTLQERCKSLEALVRDAEEEVTCRRDDAACYCPNCDRSMFNVRDRLRAALKGADQ